MDIIENLLVKVLNNIEWISIKIKLEMDIKLIDYISSLCETKKLEIQLWFLLYIITSRSIVRNIRNIEKSKSVLDIFNLYFGNVKCEYINHLDKDYDIFIEEKDFYGLCFIIRNNELKFKGYKNEYIYENGLLLNNSREIYDHIKVYDLSFIFDNAQNRDILHAIVQYLDDYEDFLSLKHTNSYLLNNLNGFTGKKISNNLSQSLANQYGIDPRVFVWNISIKKRHIERLIRKRNSSRKLEKIKRQQFKNIIKSFN